MAMLERLSRVLDFRLDLLDVEKGKKEEKEKGVSVNTMVTKTMAQALEVEKKEESE